MIEFNKGPPALLGVGRKAPMVWYVVYCTSLSAGQRPAVTMVICAVSHSFFFVSLLSRVACANCRLRQHLQPFLQLDNDYGVAVTRSSV
jgi:hypothetical protein